MYPILTYKHWWICLVRLVGGWPTVTVIIIIITSLLHHAITITITALSICFHRRLSLKTIRAIRANAVHVRYLGLWLVFTFLLKNFLWGHICHRLHPLGETSTDRWYPAFLDSPVTWSSMLFGSFLGPLSYTEFSPQNWYVEPLTPRTSQNVTVFKDGVFKDAIKVTSFEWTLAQSDWCP